MDWNQEKQAALDMLIQEGVDFDTAANAVMEKAAFLVTGAIGAYNSTDGHRWGGAGTGILGGAAGGAVGGGLGSLAGVRGAIAGGLVGTYGGAALAGHHYGKWAAKQDKLKAKEEHQEKTAGVLAKVKNSLPATMKKGMSLGKKLAIAAGAGAAAGGAAYGIKKSREQEKKAAVGMLIQGGVDFDTAVNMVENKSNELYGQEKAASAMSTVSNRLPATVGKGMSLSKKIAIAAGAGAAVGGAAYGVKKYREQEKKAALDMLIQGGVDFDTATDLVYAKADEIYGK